MIKDKKTIAVSSTRGKNKPHVISRLSDDTVLLKIHRQYSQDEAVKYVLDEVSKLKSTISQLQFTVGELKSENAELTHKNNIIRCAKQRSKDEYVEELKSIIKAKVKAKSKAEKDMIEWRNKYLDLLAKCQPNGL